MTTFQDPQPLSRRALRQSERAGSEPAAGAVPTTEAVDDAVADDVTPAAESSATDSVSWIAAAPPSPSAQVWAVPAPAAQQAEPGASEPAATQSAPSMPVEHTLTRRELRAMRQAEEEAAKLARRRGFFGRSAAEPSQDADEPVAEPAVEETPVFAPIERGDDTSDSVSVPDLFAVPAADTTVHSAPADAVEPAIVEPDVVEPEIVEPVESALAEPAVVELVFDEPAVEAEPVTEPPVVAEPIVVEPVVIDEVVSPVDVIVEAVVEEMPADAEEPTQAPQDDVLPELVEPQPETPDAEHPFVGLTPGDTPEEAAAVVDEVPAAAWTPPPGHWSVQGEMDDELHHTLDTSINRSVGGTHSATNALVLPSIPDVNDFRGALTDTGEVMLTGSIQVPHSLSSGGNAAVDDRGVDALLDLSDEFVTTDSAPIRAINAVSTHTSNHGIITAQKPKGNRALTVLLISASGLAVAVAGLLIAAFAFNAF